MEKVKAVCKGCGYTLYPEKEKRERPGKEQDCPNPECPYFGFVTPKPYAEIKELENVQENNTDCFRLFCTRSHLENEDETLFTLQIRTFQPINYQQDDKPRNMMANVNFTLRELKGLVIIAESQRRR